MTGKADLFQQVRNLFDERELRPGSVIRDFRIAAAHYNLPGFCKRATLEDIRKHGLEATIAANLKELGYGG